VRFVLPRGSVAISSTLSGPVVKSYCTSTSRYVATLTLNEPTTPRSAVTADRSCGSETLSGAAPSAICGSGDGVVHTCCSAVSACSREIGSIDASNGNVRHAADEPLMRRW
jgi:hypothetical protein